MCATKALTLLAPGLNTCSWLCSVTQRPAAPPACRTQHAADVPAPSPSIALQVVIQNVEEGHALIDRAVANAMRMSKPVYISICCNLAGATHPTFESTVPFALSPKVTNPASLKAAVKAAAEFLNKAVRPVSGGRAPA